LPAAKALGALITQNPLYRVNHITLAAPVGPDNRGYPPIKIEFRLIGKALKAVKDYLFKPHWRLSSPDAKTSLSIDFILQFCHSKLDFPIYRYSLTEGRGFQLEFMPYGVYPAPRCGDTVLE